MRYNMRSTPLIVLVLLTLIMALIMAPGSNGQIALAQTMAATAGIPPLSGEPVLVGVAVAQTGNAAGFGQEQVIGAQLAEEYYDTRGGINGRPVKIVFQDAASDENGAINAFNILINNAKVVGIVGPTLSQQAFAADPIADKAGVPVIAPSNTAVGIPQIGPYITRLSAPVNAVAPNALQAALTINPDIKKVVVFYAQDDAFSKSETVVFQNVIKANSNLQLLGVQTFSVKDTDFTSQATNALAQQPDLIVISGLQVDGGNLVKQLRELGYKGLIVGGNGFNSPNIFPVCKQFCDGIIVAQAYSYQASNPVNDAFVAAYKAKQQKNPGQFTAQSFACVQVLVEALQALDKQSKLSGMSLQDLRTALNKQVQSGTYLTPLGEVSFTTVKKDNGDPAGAEINQKQFYVAQVKMNADGTTGAFNFLSGTGAAATPAATMAATAAK